ncbi:MAG: hypothetical protein WC741_01865 [Patescibacteria group bacterium]|jgi:cell division protein FtsW (lipid II flippase)
MFKSYDTKIKKILEEKNPETDWKKVLKNHQVMIKRIQHKRLIHLLVTIFVGLVMSTSTFITIAVKTTGLLFFCIPLAMLFIGYIFHYRFLENTTQNWYLLEDIIEDNC